MKCRCCAFLVFVSLLAKPGESQTNQRLNQTTASKDAISELQRSMPSEKEFSELLTKADEKVFTFEAAVKNAKPHLDRVDTKYTPNYLDAAATAHLLISTTIKN